MNRFKFRVWDKTGGFFWGEGEGMDFKKIAFNFYDALFKEGELIFQQFTGLKDANEKEIFEGDILKFDYGDSRGVGQVIYAMQGFYIESKHGNLFQDTVLTMEHSDIIGNIFENPEFLK